MGKKKRKGEVIRMERESAIPVLKAVLVTQLASLLGDLSTKNEFERLCKRVEYTIRAWYHVHFEDMMLKYSIFDPVKGANNLKQRKVTPEQADKSEMIFLKYLFQVMEKSNFKLVTQEEIDFATSGQYLLRLPIIVDESKINQKLLKKYFEENPQDNLPETADKYIVFRRGVGIDHTTAYFFMEKVDLLLARVWSCLLKLARLKKLFCQHKNKKDPKNDDESRCQDDPDDIYVERLHLENMKLGIISHFLSKITIKEPTFNRIIVVYRPASTKEEPDRTIFLKHFKNIPMADMEIVLPEKKNPGLTPTDWVKFLGSAVVGLVTVVTSLEMPEADPWVIFAILSTVIGYCATTYFTFQDNLAAYQNLITQSMYDKQLDSGRGTLLHLCDDVIQQEVKEVIISFYILMTQGKASLRELDLRCEKLLKDVFQESCNFDVDDAVQKLEKLGIVSRDSKGYYFCIDLKRANEIIGTTTEERVLQARQDWINDEAALEK